MLWCPMYQLAVSYCNGLSKETGLSWIRFITGNMMLRTVVLFIVIVNNICDSAGFYFD